MVVLDYLNNMNRSKLRKVKKQVVIEQVQYSKSIFSSTTFWGATLTAIIPILAVTYDGVTKGFNAYHMGILTPVLTGYGLTLQGRMRANDGLPVYTPHGLPGANEEDFQPNYMEKDIDIVDAPGYIPEK
jgi:hypothetical protein